MRAPGPAFQSGHEGFLPDARSFARPATKPILPDPLNDYKLIRAFTAYDEWQNSKFSQRNPLTFYTAGFQTCQNCHMKRDGVGARRTRREEWDIGFASLAGGQHGRSFLLRLR